MTCLELIERLIAPGARVAIEPNAYNFKVTLLEPGCDSQATIYNVPEDCIVIRLDDNVDVGKMFSGSFGECKRSDFILVAETQGTLVLVHIEMKKSRGSKADIMKQLRGSRCFTHYLQELGRVFGQHSDFLKDARHRFVSIKHSGPRKRRTRIDRDAGVHDCPENVLAISSPHRVEFSMISGGR